MPCACALSTSSVLFDLHYGCTQNTAMLLVVSKPAVVYCMYVYCPIRSGSGSVERKENKECGSFGYGVEMTVELEAKVRGDEQQ